MQPYFFPYIGYWQLLAAVDKYVIYDDVNYIKGGWINRNRILNQGKVQFINVQMKGASPFKLINEVEVQQDRLVIEKSKKTLFNAYHKAEFFDEAYPVICDILDCKEKNLAKYLVNQIRKICIYLGINTDIIVSSDIKKDINLKGQDKVINICQNMDAKIYLNAIGGRELYCSRNFKEKGIELYFLESNTIQYRQLSEKFEPNLSIIDVMMNNSIDTIQKMLKDFTLIT